MLLVCHDSRERGSRHIELFVTIRNEAIFQVTVHCRCHVRRQRPGCCSPYKQLFVHVFELQVDIHARVGVLLVAVFHGHLAFANWRRVFGAVHQNFFALVNLALFIQLAKRPPDRLHVLFVHGFVCTLKLYPATKPLDSVFPLGTCFDHSCSAGLNVVFDRYFGPDFFFAGNPQLLFDKHLRRQPVAIPTPASFNPLTLHGMVPPHGVFDGRNQQVPMVRRAG